MTEEQPGTAADTDTSTGRLEAIWIKRRHAGPMDARGAATLRAGRGLLDSADQGGKRQVTLIAREAWVDATRGLGAEVAPALRRANLLISGLELEGSRGRVIVVGSCRLHVRGETTPCELMDTLHPGLKDALQPHWRGGVFAEVLDDGQIAVGDAVRWGKEL